MRPKKPSSTFKSFQELKAILNKKSLPDYHPPVTKEYRKKPSPDLEKELFKKELSVIIDLTLELGQMLEQIERLASRLLLET